MANKKVKVKLNRAGVRDLLRSQELLDCCQSYANAALSRLGEGHAVTTYVGTNRVTVRLAATWNQTRSAALKGNTLLKALGGGSND
jgi:hypothetical protein